MRRILFTVMAAAALCVAVPTAALAHGSRQHKRHHRVRHEFFKAHRHDSGTSSGSSSGTTAPTAGTVTSFANNVLTITLANGTTVSGTVTSDTELKCENSATQNGDNDADDNGAGDEQGDAVFDHHGDNGDNGDNGDQGDQGNSQTCTPTPGEAVRSAELTITGNGAVWTAVELVSSSTSTTTPTTPTTPSSQS
jgi:hypothetical protein